MLSPASPILEQPQAPLILAGGCQAKEVAEEFSNLAPGENYLGSFEKL